MDRSVIAIRFLKGRAMTRQIFSNFFVAMKEIRVSPIYNAISRNY